MKKLTRISVIVIVIGISLLLVTVMRGSSPYGNITVGGPDVTPDHWDLYQDYFFPSRTLSLEVNSNVTSDVYILNQACMNQWLSNGTIRSVLSLTNVKHDLATSEVDARGAYGILIHNASNETGTIKATVTLYGLEKDLLYGSITLIGGGLIILAVSFVVRSRKK